MSGNHIIENPFLRFGFFFGIWTLLGLFWASRLYNIYNMDEPIVPWDRALVWGMSEFYIWGALSPIVAALAARFNFSRSNWIISTFVHLIAAVVLTSIHLYITTAAFKWLHGLDYLMKSMDDPTVTEMFLSMMVTKFHSSAIVYIGILFAVSAVMYYRRFREESLKAAEIESRLAEAELTALKMQLHPHFLFNTLNTIASLMHEDIEQADKMIVRLGSLLRTSLESTGEMEITLREELDFLQKYLEIEQVRFQERMKVEYDIDKETMTALLPNLILQPLVENAIKYGVGLKESETLICIRAKRDREFLMISITDTGPGLPADFEQRMSERVGLANTRARLQQMYAEGQSFEIASNSDGGVYVNLKIPFHVK